MDIEKIKNVMKRHGLAIFGGVVVAISDLFLLFTPAKGDSIDWSSFSQTITWNMTHVQVNAETSMLWTYLGIMTVVGLSAILYSLATYEGEVDKVGTP